MSPIARNCFRLCDSHLFQYVLYLKLERSEKNVFWYSHIFIIFKALVPYLEHKGELMLKIFGFWSFLLCLLTILTVENFAWIMLVQRKCQNRLNAKTSFECPIRAKSNKNSTHKNHWKSCFYIIFCPY